MDKEKFEMKIDPKTHEDLQAQPLENGQPVVQPEAQPVKEDK